MLLERSHIEANGTMISHKGLVSNSFKMVTYIKDNLKMGIKAEEEN